LQSWQLFYHRDGAWSHPQSAAGSANNPAPTPDGIRLELTLPNQQRLRRDWVNPRVGGEP
jgi:general secretion pathway protein J